MIYICRLRGLSPRVLLELNTVQDKVQALSLSSERKDGLFAPTASWTKEVGALTVDS